MTSVTDFGSCGKEKIIWRRGCFSRSLNKSNFLFLLTFSNQVSNRLMASGNRSSKIPSSLLIVSGVRIISPRNNPITAHTCANKHLGNQLTHMQSHTYTCTHVTHIRWVGRRKILCQSDINMHVTEVIFPLQNITGDGSRILCCL